MEIDVPHLFFWEPFALVGTPLAINRVVVLTWVAAALCTAFFVLGARRKSIVPRGLQTVAEDAYLFVRNQIAIDVIGPQEGIKYAGYLTTLFFFVFFSNFLEIVPGINFPVTSRMGVPAFLAVATWVIFNFIGIRKQGLGHYIKGTLFPPGVPWPVYILLTPIELFSVFIIRPFTLAVRLFGNMFAGHTLLTIFFLFTAGLVAPQPSAPLGLLTLAVSSVLIIFELLIISLQAYIFTMLTAFYIAEAVHGHGEEDTSVATRHDEAVPETELVAA